ncbi:cytochrome c oxidase assembly protein [Acuticoccus sp. I52.16.1]|uniref:cytochrome c oxidase assembly protein n=1 Tax=Acuticoccus sp. I52.16.1 TaxID=2928472 RepID=UPI001FD36E10|nr:cytochrome c oxidase assembly protein [Acuticoccus sp. I52.16.1]UOM32835.1 cytochrome c oxidase assembly protein [Acuticoccus sp. I52.16.1]
MSGDKRHIRIALACAAFVSLMVGAAFASVPLYDLFCRVTGFDGTPSIATVEAVPGLEVGERELTIRFDANIQSNLPWTFKPVQRTMKVKVGEVVTAEYEITNLSDEHTVGQSVYNVTPFQGGGYFTKIDCFCFTAQPLEANETRRIPVVFYVDPEFDEDRDAKNVHVITLSYTFFKAQTAS